MAGFDWRRAQNMEISPLCDIARFCNIAAAGDNAGNTSGGGNIDGGRAVAVVCIIDLLPLPSKKYLTNILH